MSTEESKDKDKVGPALNANGKAKDLSHVPCKFYKVGGCTAGASCPFSHTMTASTGDKDVCAWFVKGNCKFGHKCALAHVLPGQGMAMDRKNKRAAMVAAGKGGREREKKSGGGGAGGGGGGGGGGKRPPITMSLKATMSPSAPAPALKDTDFERKKSGLSRKMEEEPAPPPPPPPPSKPSFADAVKPKEEKEEKETLPVSTPRTSLSPSKPPADFGPIGSPPRGSLPHGGSLPLSHHLPGSSPFAGSWAGSRWAAPPPPEEVTVDDGEMFLPGSLSDLLTAEELARRSGVSRSVPVSSLLSSSASPHTWSSPPQSAYLNLAPSNASGAFLQSPSTRLNMSSYLANGPQRQQPVAAADIPPVGVSLPQGLAAGYSRIHARPAETKTHEWGASSYGTTAGSFGGSPLPSSSSFWNPHPTFAALSPPHDRASFRPPAFASDRFADRQAGIEPKGSTIDADDDLFVLDG